MRQLLRWVCWILLLGTLGFFMAINRHQAPIHLFQAYSLHISVWALVLGSLAVGAMSAYIWVWVKNPNRWFQRLRIGWKDRQGLQQENAIQAFQEACSQGIPKQIEQAAKRLQTYDSLTLPLKVRRLEALRFSYPLKSLLEQFAALQQQAPHNLYVLLGKFRVLLDAKEWDQLEQVGIEILQNHPEHPEVLSGMVHCYEAQENWAACVQVEKQLIQLSPQSLGLEHRLSRHSEHLLQYFESVPESIKTWKTSYLPKSVKFEQQYAVLLKRLEARALQKQHQFIPAAKLLQKEYQRTLAPLLLDEIYDVFVNAGRPQALLSLMKKLNKKLPNLDTQLMLSQMHVDLQEWEQASQLLQQAQGQHAVLPEKFHTLSYHVATAQKEQSKQLEAASHLICAH